MKKLLKMFRRKKWMTQQELADKAFCSNTFICKLEKGLASPNLETAERIAKALDTTIEECFEDVPVVPQQKQ